MRLAGAKPLLEQLVQQTYDDREQRRTLDEGGGKDHGTTNIGGGFGLAGDAFGGFATDESDSESSAEGGDTCSKSSHKIWI